MGVEGESPWRRRSIRFKSSRTLGALAVLFFAAFAVYEHFLLSSGLYTSPAPLTGEHQLDLEPADDVFSEVVRDCKDNATNVVVVLAASDGYQPMLLNMECSLRRVGINVALLIALDHSVFMWAQAGGFYRPVLAPGLVDEPGKTPQLIADGVPRFAEVTMQKFMVIERVLATGVDVIFTDEDVFWCTNPVPEILRASARDARSDMLFQTSWAAPDDGDFINSGFYYARPTRGAREIFRRNSMDFRNMAFAHDQRGVINRLCNVEAGGRVVYEWWWNPFRDPRPKFCTSGGTQIGFLDHRRFPAGRLQIEKILSRTKRSEVRAMCDRGDVAILHNSWSEGERKILWFQAKGLWYASRDNSTCLDSPVLPTLEQLEHCDGLCKPWIMDLEQN